MSEEELKAIEQVKKLLENATPFTMPTYIYFSLEKVLNLITKQQKEIENIKQYAEWHISHITEDIKDYIDDDKKGNENIIAELKEQREHWKDIIRITKNEKTYMDYLEG